jgi:hypothetical protein
MSSRSLHRRNVSLATTRSTSEIASLSRCYIYALAAARFKQNGSEIYFKCQAFTQVRNASCQMPTSAFQCAPTQLDDRPTCPGPSCVFEAPALLYRGVETRLLRFFETGQCKAQQRILPGLLAGIANVATHEHQIESTRMHALVQLISAVAESLSYVAYVSKKHGEAYRRVCMSVWS